MSQSQIKYYDFPCRLCFRHHALRICQKFLAMSVEERMRVVLKHNYCANCLAHRHSNGSCFSKFGCHHCKGDHHTLLHMHSQLRINLRLPQTPASAVAPSNTTRSIKLQPTVLVNLDIGSIKHQARALIDPLIAISRISESMVKILQIPMRKSGDDSCCTLVISSILDNKITLETTLRVDSQIFMRTPVKSLSSIVKVKFQNLILADPLFHKSAAIQLVFGADIYQKILKPGMIPSSGGFPSAQDTILGWVLSGTIANN